MGAPAAPLKPDPAMFDRVWEILKKQFGITSGKEVLFADDDPKNLPYPSNHLEWRVMEAAPRGIVKVQTVALSGAARWWGS